MNNSQKPRYPIRIDWPEDGPEFYKDEMELCREVEWFDSEDKSEPIEAFDADNKPVLLVLEALEVLELQFK